MKADLLAFEDSNGTDPEVMREIWARRAARLAKVPEQEDEGEHIALVLIRLGQEIYGLEAQYVFDIRPLAQITTVPRAPDWVAGVVNLRGRIISVLDLPRFLGLSRGRTDRKEPGEPASGDALEEKQASYLVVIETPEMELALLTDEVLTVNSVPVSQIQDVSHTMMLNLRPDYVRGIIRHGDGEKNKTTLSRNGNDASRQGEADHRLMLVILNLPALLADKRLIIQEEIA